MPANPNPPRGRGTGSQPGNRFESRYTEADWSDYEGADPELSPDRSRVPTEVLPDHAVSILSTNNSPDLPFEVSLNPYRGCEHGCAYCYARPSHEYLGLSAGLDFETKLFYKERAPELLEAALSKPSWKVKPLMLSGITDCYQPLESKLQLTRRCLEVLQRLRNPVSLISKNTLMLRDIDLLAEMAQWNGVHVTLSITSLNIELAGKMEPRAARPKARLEAVRQLATAGIPVGVNIAPVVPGLNDTELIAILRAAKEAGAKTAYYQVLRLPLAVKSIFEDWLRREFPGRADTVLARIRELHAGKLDDSRFGRRFSGDGILADTYRQWFRIESRKLGLNHSAGTLNCEAFRRPGGTQLGFQW
ncbi:MAG: PA0069 family radical SAM protein [Opitutales bacterium]|nr:PA0069 family radical SAM protein [Opitutales bacterium]